MTAHPFSMERITHRIKHVNTFWAEFRQFAFQGNVLDLGIGFVIGTSFKQLTSSFVDNILMPPIGFLIGRANFSDLYISLSGQKYASLAEAQAAGAPTLNYGLFITQFIDFLLVALSIFIVLKFVWSKVPPSKVAPSQK